MRSIAITQIKEVANKLGYENILCQLAEESSELSQACLKYRRACKGLTPKTKNEVYENLIEELADVLLNSISPTNFPSRSTVILSQISYT